jgi:homogentisate 1,2-dioxygenase
MALAHTMSEVPADSYISINMLTACSRTEAVDGALPLGANSPQKPPFGLYAEKLSGTAFTAPRHENQQTWLYRILPSAAHSSFSPRESSTYNTNPQGKKMNQIPNQLRWDPFDMDETVDWVHSLHLVAGAGDPTMKSGLGIMIFAAGRDMSANEAFYSADGDFLIVLQHGVLDIQTELGHLLIRPNEIVVIPRGIKYRVTLPAGPVRGYILELYQGHFQLPELGPIGSNCLANARDFQAPIGAFDEDHDGSNTWEILCKFDGHLFAAKQTHTPFDVVAWHGLYYPYKYDLGRFNTIGTVSFDHPDPSIFTVLTGPSDHVGTAIADFVIFPPRWLVGEDTFRPPWYHRNTMSEFMGLIHGDYDAKTGGGFRPAGASLHNIMSAHGPDSSTHEKASNTELKPAKVGEGSMAFMFESCLMVGVTDWGLKQCKKVQEDYNEESWTLLKAHFKRPEGENSKDHLLDQSKAIDSGREVNGGQKVEK